MKTTQKKRTGLITALAIVTLSITTVSLAVPAQASTAAENHASEEVLAQLRGALTAAAQRATPGSQADLDRLDNLSAPQRAELVDYLLGGHDASPIAPSGRTVERSSRTVVIRDGLAEWTHLEGETRKELASDSTRAASYNVHSYADEIFKFAGISLTRTRVWGDYVTGSGQVLRTIGRGSQVLHNYQPLTDISTSDYSPLLSGGKVLFRAKITVKRGPAPGLGGNWSTKEGIQYFRANGPGVYAHGWM